MLTHTLTIGGTGVCFMFIYYYVYTFIYIWFNAIYRETNNMLLFTDRLRKIRLSFVFVSYAVLATLRFFYFLVQFKKCCLLTVNYLYAWVCILFDADHTPYIRYSMFLSVREMHTLRYTNTWAYGSDVTILKPL